MENQDLLKLNLQFFAEDGDNGTDSGSEDGGSAENNGDQSQGDSQGAEDSKAGEKTFTQAELTAVAANEKKQGKQSILNIFGVKDEKTAKEQAKAFNEWREAQKTAEQKLKDQESATAEANLRAFAAENKLTCIMAGVNKDSIDDIMAIAVPKVTDDKDLNAVLEDMKKEPRYKGFFTTVGSSGTGSSAGHQNGSSGTGGTDNIGERLGKNKAQEVKKSNFFTN